MGTSAIRASALVTRAATSRSAPSSDSGSSSSVWSASIAPSEISALGAAAARSSLDRAVRIRRSRLRGSLRATIWRMATVALSAAWISSTTSTRGLSSAAASTTLRKESASRKGMTSAAHSTGRGTPGNALKISGETRVSSLSASGSAPPIARCSVSCLISSASTPNGSSRSASYAWARAIAAPSIWQVDTNALVSVVFPTPGSPRTATMRGSRRRTSSQASYRRANSRSRPISVSASKRRS